MATKSRRRQSRLSYKSQSRFLVGADAAVVLSAHVAVETETLKRRGKLISNRPSVNIIGRSANCASMCIAVVTNMIQGQETDLALATTDAMTAIPGNDGVLSVGTKCLTALQNLVVMLSIVLLAIGPSFFRVLYIPSKLRDVGLVSVITHPLIMRRTPILWMCLRVRFSPCLAS